MFRISFALVCLLFISSVSYASIDVTGTITDDNSQPLAGVVLTLVHDTDVRIVTSQSNGFFQFEGVATGQSYSLTPLLANYSFSPTGRVFLLLGSLGSQNFTGTLDRFNASPLDTPEFFVRQQYVDLLLREPDEGGLNFWAADLKACTTSTCRYQKRRDILCAFVTSGDYQSRFTGPSITVCQ